MSASQAALLEQELLAGWAAWRAVALSQRSRVAVAQPRRERRSAGVAVALGRQIRGAGALPMRER